jgi:hypothetical protein
LRLCGHRGTAPKSAKINITIKTVPSIVFSFQIQPSIFRHPDPAVVWALVKPPPRARVDFHYRIRGRLVKVKADGNAIAGISAVIQIVSITVIVNVHVIAVVPVV